jgi:hypothetical protein
MTPDWCWSSSGAASSWVHRLLTQRQRLDGERPHLEVCIWDPGPGVSVDDHGRSVPLVQLTVRVARRPPCTA